jgi:hypothetical protein
MIAWIIYLVFRPGGPGEGSSALKHFQSSTSEKRKFGMASSDWKVETSKHYVDFGNGAGTWVPDETIMRADGVKLQRKGTGRERQRYIIYDNGDISFEFTASRYDGDGIKLLDTWTILLSNGLDRIQPKERRAAIGPDHVQEIVAAIGDAFRNWPMVNDYQPPAEKFRFF